MVVDDMWSRVMYIKVLSYSPQFTSFTSNNSSLIVGSLKEWNIFESILISSEIRSRSKVEVNFNANCEICFSMHTFLEIVATCLEMSSVFSRLTFKFRTLLAISWREILLYDLPNIHLRSTIPTIFSWSLILSPWYFKIQLKRY